jgi:cell division protein FtsL
MAVASVLEKNTNTVEQQVPTSPQMAARIKEDEEHNALIRENFAKILSPDFKREQISEFQRVSVRPIVEQPTNQMASTIAASTVAQPTQTYTASQTKTSARADAAIFRADSPINRVKGDDVSTPIEYVPPFEMEEENEDLMPTATTRQYRTSESKHKEKGKSFTLSKKEKILIASFVSLVVLLFTVIIINSAIISGMNASIGKAQNDYKEIQNTYQVIEEQLEESQQLDTVLEKASNLNLIP